MKAKKKAAPVDLLTAARKSKRLWTTAELAALLNVKEQTIRVWVMRGMIPSVKAGTSRRFNPRDIVAWMKKRGAGQQRAKRA